jgi:hypothetical protein
VEGASEGIVGEAVSIPPISEREANSFPYRCSIRMIRFLLYSLAVSLSLLSCLGAWFLFFVNPLNWKDFQDYGAADRFIAPASDVAIFLLLVFTLFIIWRVAIRYARSLSRPAI